MPRPCKKRKICLKLKTPLFKPIGVDLHNLEEVILEVDEMEAVRLADHEGQYQEEAARAMCVSRATFSNIVNRAHAKIAAALIEGRPIRINCPKLAAQQRGKSHVR